MKYFIQVSLITYIASMLVYTLWSSITFATLDKGWIGSGGGPISIYLITGNGGFTF